jgi:NADH-quinone oxidoreductase subunit G
MEISDVDVPIDLKNILKEVKVSTQHKSIAKKLVSNNSHIIVGLIAQLREDSSQIISMANLISIISKSSMGIINFASNSSGAWLTGCIPHRIYNGLEIKESEQGYNFSKMVRQENNLWFLKNIEMADCNNSYAFKKNLLQSFVVNISAFDSEEARQFSDIMLPVATNYEIDGSFINCLGMWQEFRSSVPLLEKSKKSWKVIKTLANYLDLEGFKYSKIEDVQNDIKALVDRVHFSDSKFKTFLPTITNSKTNTNGLYVNIIHNIYNSDNIVRRATSLQKTVDAKNKECLFISLEYAKKNNLSNFDKVNLTNGSESLPLNIMVKDNIEKNVMIAYLGTKATATLERLNNNFMLERIK